MTADKALLSHRDESQTSLCHFGSNKLRAEMATDEGLWDELVGSAASGEIFHTSAWLELTGRVFGADLLRLGIFEGPELVAGLPLFSRRTGPLTVSGSPLPGMSTPHLGPFYRDPSYLHPLLDLLDTVLGEKHSAVTEIICPKTAGAPLLSGRGFSSIPHETMVVDLRGKTKEQVWASFKSECRTACRKAEREGVTIVRATDDSFMSDYLRMVIAVFAKQGRESATPEAFYREAWSSLSRSERLHVMLAFHDEKIVAGAFFLAYKGWMYYLDGASFPEHYSLRANDLIQWSIIQWGIENGIHSYDMVGADAPGFVRFKRSFGAELVAQERARRFSSPFARFALSGYLRARPMSRRLRYALRRSPAS